VVLGYCGTCSTTVLRAVPLTCILWCWVQSCCCRNSLHLHNMGSWSAVGGAHNAVSGTLDDKLCTQGTWIYGHRRCVWGTFQTVHRRVHENLCCHSALSRDGHVGGTAAAPETQRIHMDIRHTKHCIHMDASSTLQHDSRSWSRPDIDLRQPSTASGSPSGSCM
jgi:hypothetical protein